MIWRTIVILAFLAATGALLIELGAHASDEATQYFLGTLCGIGASIPVSIGLLMVLTRERKPSLDDDEYERPAGQRIIVIRPQPKQLSDGERR
jgi:hypothetical protein